MSPFKKHPPAPTPPPMPPGPALAELLLRVLTHGVPVHLHVHYDDPAASTAFTRIAAQLTRLITGMEKLQMKSDAELALLQRLNTATNAIAAGIRRLKDKTDDPEMLAAIEAHAVQLEAMAADPENPVPAAPPEPVL